MRFRDSKVSSIAQEMFNNWFKCSSLIQLHQTRVHFPCFQTFITLHPRSYFIYFTTRRCPISYTFLKSEKYFSCLLAKTITSNKQMRYNVLEITLDIIYDLQVNRSNGTRIHIRKADWFTKGKYRCEVTAADFETASDDVITEVVGKYGIYTLCTASFTSLISIYQRFALQSLILSIFSCTKTKSIHYWSKIQIFSGRGC